MRNLFDQYEQPENRLTHALISALHNDRRLVRPFLLWLGVKAPPQMKSVHIGQQQAPGAEAEAEKEGGDGLPDACFFDDEDWAVLIESKVQAAPSASQLRRHRKTAARYGYSNPFVVLLAVDPSAKRLPDETICRQWREVYGWFSLRARRHDWARLFVEYMQVFESKMLAQGYTIRGTLTMFTGFHFTDDNPYTYREGKRLIRLMGQEFRKRKLLVKALGLNPGGDGRPAITRGDAGAVWDFIPLKAAKGKVFTAFPHATMSVRSTGATVAITIPNSVKGGIKRRLRNYGKTDFANILVRVEANLRKVVKRVPGAKPIVYVQQRRYKSQRSYPEIDGQIEVDLRTLVDSNSATLKHQPGWLDAIHGVLAAKKTNIQTGIEVRFPYSAKMMQSEKALDVMGDAWIALKPFLHFALNES